MRANRPGKNQSENLTHCVDEIAAFSSPAASLDTPLPERPEHWSVGEALQRKTLLERQRPSHENPPPLQNAYQAGVGFSHYCLRCLTPARENQPQCARCAAPFQGAGHFDLLTGRPPSQEFAFLFTREPRNQAENKASIARVSSDALVSA